MNEPITPLAAREEAIKYISTWLETQPSTLALFRAQPSEADNKLGVFTSLGTTKLIAVEQDGGTRDGHQYWKHARSWSIHVRWYGLHWIFLHLQSRQDDQDLLDILQHGTVLFDKVAISQPLVALAHKSIIHKRVGARQAYDFRIDLADAIVELDDIYANLGSINDDILEKLFDIYFTVLKIAERLTTRSETAAKKALAAKLSKAGRSRVDLSEAVLTLRELVDRLLRKLGGTPTREFYTPANAIHCMPPDPKRPETMQSQEPIAEQFLCTTCGRLFANPIEPGLPIIVSTPDSAPAAIPISSQAKNAQESTE